MKSRIRVLSVDDHPVIHEGIVEVINGQSDMQVVSQASNGHEAVECFVRHLMGLTVAELSASLVHQVTEQLTSMLANAQAAKRWLAAEPPNLMEAIASIDRIARDARRRPDYGTDSGARQTSIVRHDGSQHPRPD